MGRPRAWPGVGACRARRCRSGDRVCRRLVVDCPPSRGPGHFDRCAGGGVHRRVHVAGRRQPAGTPVAPAADDRARVKPVARAVAVLATSVAVDRRCRRGAGLAGDDSVAGHASRAGRVVAGAGAGDVALCRVRGLSDDPGHARTRIARPVSHRDCRQRLLSVRGAFRVPAGRAVRIRRHRAGRRGHRHGPAAAHAAPHRAARRPRPGAAGARRRIGARLRDGRDSAPAAAAMDHDRLGARRGCAGLALSPHPASRTAVLRDRAAVGRLRPARTESRRLRL